MSTYKPFYEEPEFSYNEIGVGSPESARLAIETATSRQSAIPPSGVTAGALLYNPATKQYAFGDQVLGELGAKDLMTVASEATKVGEYHGPRPDGFVSIDHYRLLDDLNSAMAKENQSVAWPPEFSTPSRFQSTTEKRQESKDRSVDSTETALLPVVGIISGAIVFMFIGSILTKKFSRR